MTLKELKSNMGIWPVNINYEAFIVTIYYRNRKYSCSSSNSLAYKRMLKSVLNEMGNNVVMNSYTLKAAYMAFYNECKIKNGLKI